MDYMKKADDFKLYIVENHRCRIEDIPVKRWFNNQLYSHLTDLTSREKVTKRMLKLKAKVPIYINQEVLWMCIRSYRLHECFYINYFSIMSYTYEAEFVMIHFYDDHVMKLAQVGEFKTQMKRCLKLLEFIKNRKCLHR